MLINNGTPTKRKQLEKTSHGYNKFNFIPAGLRKLVFLNVHVHLFFQEKLKSSNLKIEETGYNVGPLKKILQVQTPAPASNRV